MTNGNSIGRGDTEPDAPEPAREGRSMTQRPFAALKKGSTRTIGQCKLCELEIIKCNSRWLHRDSGSYRCAAKPRVFTMDERFQFERDWDKRVANGRRSSS